MQYHGLQFRAARAVTRLGVLEICAQARMSARTLANLEDAGPVSYGVRMAGLFEEATVAKLVAYYERQGVSFVAASGGHGPGIRYSAGEAVKANKPAAQASQKAARSGKARR